MYSSSLGSEKVGCIAIVSNKYVIHHYFFKETNNMSMHHYHIAVLIKILRWILNMFVLNLFLQLTPKTSLKLATLP